MYTAFNKAAEVRQMYLAVAEREKRKDEFLGSVFQKYQLEEEDNQTKQPKRIVINNDKLQNVIHILTAYDAFFSTLNVISHSSVEALNNIQ